MNWKFYLSLPYCLSFSSNSPSWSCLEQMTAIYSSLERSAVRSETPKECLNRTTIIFRAMAHLSHRCTVRNESCQRMSPHQGESLFDGWKFILSKSCKKGPRWGERVMSSRIVHVSLPDEDINSCPGADKAHLYAPPVPNHSLIGGK